MGRHLRPLAKTALLLACAALPLAGGCDKAENAADRRAAANLNEGAMLLDQGRTPQEAAQYQSRGQKAIEAAAAEADASPAMQASAKAMAAEESQRRAIELQPALDEKEHEAIGLIEQISTVVTEIESNNVLAAGSLGSNPQGIGTAKPKDVLDKKIIALTNQVAEQDKAIAAHTQAIKLVQQNIEGLNQKRVATLDQATVAQRASEQLKAEAALKRFSQAKELEAEAAGYGIQAERVRLGLQATPGLDALGFKATAPRVAPSLEELQTNLAAAQAAKAAFESGLQQAQNEVKALNTAWTQAQQAMAKARAASATTAKTLAAKSAELAKLVNEAAALRAPIVDTHLTAAIRAFGEADSAAVKFGLRLNELRTQEGPGADGWRRVATIQSPEIYKLNRADALFDRGRLHLKEKTLVDAELQLATRMAPVLQKAGIAIPPTLAPAALTAASKAAAAKAREDLTLAESLFGEVMESNLPIDRGESSQRLLAIYRAEAARGRVLAKYALYRLTGAPTHLAEARKLLGDLANPKTGEESSERLAFPPLPEELESGVIRAAVVPTGAGPATAPTVTPTTPPRATQGAPAPRGGPWSNLLKKAAGGN